MNTNQKKITTSKQTQIIAVAILAASIIAAAITGGISTGQILQKAMAQEVYAPQTGSAAAEANEVQDCSVKW